MIETLIAPEDETFPNRRRWTRTECQRMVEIGFLTGRYELIDGEVLSKMGQHAPHATALMLIKHWLTAVFGDLFARPQLPIVVPGEEGETTEPEPDLAVTREPATAYTENNPGPQDVSLVVEVADSSLNFDLNTKALLYARVGIPEYWVMDINGRRLHRHRQPTHSGYLELVVLSEAESVSPLSRSETVCVGDLLPAPRPAAA